ARRGLDARLQVAGGGACLPFSPDGGTPVTGGERGGVRLWDLASGGPRVALRGQGGLFALGPDGKVAASAGPDRVVHLWDVDAGKELAALWGHTEGVGCAAFSPDGRVF